MKEVVITGGTGGLGSAIADVFRTPGWNVLTPGSADFDVRDPAAVARYFSGKSPDLLVCSAGIVRDAPLVKLAESAWDEVMAVNYSGAENCSAAVLPEMIRRGQGHIIFISSYSALHPSVGQAAYATAKSALLGLTAALAERHGPANIRVNAILPGLLETPMTAEMDPVRLAGIRADHRLGRFNTPGAVAAFIRTLHDDLPHTSGQVFQLDSRRAFFP